MKMRVIIIVLSVLTAPLSASSATASSAAQAWLRNHAGSPGELDELKGANPEAFAIVQALLTKRSLGLLDNKHPTASMTDLAPPAQQQAETPGPEAFAALAGPAEGPHASGVAVAATVALPYANVGHSHHDWLNWKPDSSSADEAMVSNVLGMVGGMKAGAAAPVEESAPEPEAPVVQHREVVEEAAQEAPAPKATAGGWGDIGGMLGLHKKPHHQAVAAAPMEEAPEAEVAVQPSSKKDWGSVQKLKQSSDDKAVSNLLNMVAQMKGGKAAQKLLQKHAVVAEEDTQSSLSGDLAAWGDAPEEAEPVLAPVSPHRAPPAEEVAEVAPAAPVEAAVAAPEPEKASSWGSIGGMLGVHEKPHHHMAAATFTTAVAAAPAVELPYAEVKPSHHNWLNWKPPSTDADSAMVANALSMIGNKGSVAASETPQAAPEPVQEAAPAPEAEAPAQAEAPPARGGDKDEKAVNSLLNMVAQLKGGKAAEKLLAKHHVSAPAEEAPEEDVFSRGAAAISQPAPVAEEAPAQKASSWGSFGAMLGVKPKAKPVAVQHFAVAETPAISGMPAEVQSLFTESDRPVQHAAAAPKGDDYKKVMAAKQNSDDSAVKKLLSMVAKMKGGAKAEQLAEKYGSDDSETDSPLAAQADSPLAKDDGIFGNPFGTPVAEAPVEAAPVQLSYTEEAPEPVHHHHHYASLVKASSDVAAEVPVAEVAQSKMVEEVLEAPAAPPARRSNKFLESAPEPPHTIATLAENSYLKEFDLKTESEETETSHAVHSSAVDVASARANFEASANAFRSSFAKSDSSDTSDFEKTWKNSADSKADAIQQFFSKTAPAKPAPVAHKKKNLLAWLDADQEEPAAAKPVVAAQPEAPANPYIADLM